MNNNDKVRLQVALQIITSTDAWDECKHDLDSTLTRSVYHLEQSINDEEFV